MNRRIRWSFAVAIVIIALSVSLTALAADRVMPSETTLAFKGLITEPQQRTLQIAITGEPITSVEVVRHDLRDTTSGATILGPSLIVEPLKIEEVKNTASFAITVSGAKVAGHYTGTLDVRYADQGVTQTLTINLDAMLESVPAVDSTSDSKNLLWLVDTNASLAQPIFLKQTAVGDAEVQAANVLLMRDAKGNALPEGVVRVEAALPMTLAPSAARPITVAVRGDVPAGEYSGVLQVKVRNQPAAVEVPIKIKSKHGPIVPLIVLLIGLITSGVLSYYNGEGRKKQELGDKITAALDDIQAGNYVQIDQLKTVLDLFEQAMTSWNAGTTQEIIQAKLDAALKAATDARAVTKEFIKTVTDKIAQVQGLDVAKTLSKLVSADLSRIQQAAEKGTWKTLAAAKMALDQADKKVQFLMKLKELIDTLTPEQLTSIRADLDAASDIRGFSLALAKVSKENELLGIVPDDVSFATGLPAEAAIQARGERLKLKILPRLMLRGMRLFMSVLVYVFALVVGYLTIYANNDAFGADLQNYLTLFLWGAVIESVRGKTVTLTEIKALWPGAGTITPTSAPVATPGVTQNP